MNNLKQTTNNPTVQDDPVVVLNDAELTQLARLLDVLMEVDLSKKSKQGVKT